jgi:polar amino acid transport system substrate-binding protein
MKKKYWLAVLSLSSLICNNLHATDDKAVKVRADYWCPYNCNPTDPNPGYMIEILQTAFGKDKVNYETLNWARAILDTREGKFDAIVGAAKDDAPDFIFSIPAGLSKNCFYTKNTNKFKYTGIESLSTVKLGIVKDYAYFEDLNAYIKKNYSNRNLIDEHYGDEVQDKMLQKLEAGRIDAFVEDPNVTLYVLKKHPEIKDVVEVGCNQIGDLYIAFPPGNPKSKERAAKVTETMNSMIKNGEMAKILDKYSLKPWYK